MNYCLLNVNNMNKRDGERLVEILNSGSENNKALY